MMKWIFVYEWNMMIQLYANTFIINVSNEVAYNILLEKIYINYIPANKMHVQ